MNQAKNNPASTGGRVTYTDELETVQKPDIDLSLDSPLARGAGLAEVAGGVANNQALIDALQFDQDPLTIRIEENSSSDYPETHVPVYVNGRPAEVLQNGRWLPIGWLPIGVALTIKRAAVEVLARSRSDNIKTVHQDATVERPSNRVSIRTKNNYPLSIIKDANPRGAEWLSAIMMGH